MEKKGIADIGNDMGEKLKGTSWKGNRSQKGVYVTERKIIDRCMTGKFLKKWEKSSYSQLIHRWPVSYSYPSTLPWSQGQHQPCRK